MLGFSWLQEMMIRGNANVCEKRIKHILICLKYIFIEGYSGDICSLTKFKVGIRTNL